MSTSDPSGVPKGVRLTIDLDAAIGMLDNDPQGACMHLSYGMALSSNERVVDTGDSEKTDTACELARGASEMLRIREDP
jgi:hypothetical protein